MLEKLSVKTKILAGFMGVALLYAAPVSAAIRPAGQPMQVHHQPQFMTQQQWQQMQQQQQFQQFQQQQWQQQLQQPQMFQMQQPMNPNFIPANQVNRMPQATPATRITGSLPKVGSAHVNAGRMYYRPDGFDRLADSGLYIGLSLGYTYSLTGGMLAQYAGQPNAWYVPGAFRQANFSHETVIPLQISVGAAINNDVRIDFSYLRYAGISYPGTVQTSDGAGGFFGVQATGGRVSSTATMLNIYYNLDSYTGVLAGGSLRPYIGIGLGISTNTIADYLIYDASFYPEPGIEVGDVPTIGTLTAISDIFAYHSGGTTEQLAYAIEVGVTSELEGGLKLDFFLRWAQLGRVESSGSIVVSQTEWLATGAAPIGNPDSEMPALYDSVFHYTNWKEGGRLGVLDLGVRLRIQF